MDQFNDTHAERAVLATLLKNPSFLNELDGKINLSAFKNPANRTLLSLILKLREDGFNAHDLELLQSRLITMPIPDGIEIYQLQNYLTALFTAQIEEVNLNTYLTELRESHLKDSLNILLQQTVSDLANHPMPSKILGSLQTKLYDLDANINKNDDPIDISKDIRNNIYKLIDKPKLGIPTGLDILDEIILGWMPSKFYFVGARPGAGKSAFLLQTATHAAFFNKRQRVPVLYMNTEFDEEEFEIRLIAHIAGIDTKIIQQGLWVNDLKMKENVERALFFIHQIGGFYHKELPGYTLGQITSIMRKYVYNFGVGLIIFDQIEEPADETGRARWDNVGLVGRTLKQQAQILKVPVVAALQQNKEGEEKSRVSSKAYAESDDIYKKADGAFALNRKNAQEIQKETLSAGTHRLQILKGRYYGTLYNGLNLRYIGPCLRFWPARIQFTEGVQEQNNDGGENGQSALPQITEEFTAPLVPVG
jgi:replicative DNA helicase